MGMLHKNWQNICPCTTAEIGEYRCVSPFFEVSKKHLKVLIKLVKPRNKHNRLKPHSKIVECGTTNFHLLHIQQSVVIAPWASAFRSMS